jgi:hypothetical protein
LGGFAFSESRRIAIGPAVLLSVNADFRIYRRHGNKVIATLMPEK